MKIRAVHAAHLSTIIELRESRTHNRERDIVQGFSGTLSDKLQKRKPVALAGYFLAAVAKPLMGLSTDWQGVFGARLLDRLGAGTRSAPRDALIASSVDEGNRGRAFGLEGLGDNAGAFLGPLLAVFLLYALHVSYIGKSGSLQGGPM